MADHPAIDPRGPTELIAETEALVEQNTPWRRSDGDRLDAIGALIRVFARMAAHATDALRRAPERNFLSFLEIVGARPRPPQAARAPLTFTLADGTPNGALVPARTRVAADGDDSVAFETTAPLYASAVPLRAVFARDPAADRHAELTDLLDPQSTAPRALLIGDRPLPHALHLGCAPALGLPGLRTITVELDFIGLPAAAVLALPLAWSCRDTGGWRPLAVQLATAVAGDAIRLQVTTTDPPAPAPADVAGRLDRWLRLELRPDRLLPWWTDHVVHGQGEPQPAAAMLATLPRLRRARIAATARLGPAAPRRAACGLADLDLSKDTYPFGQDPKYGDALHLDPCALDGLTAGALVTLAVTLPPAPPVAPKRGPALELTWEVYTARGWQRVGRSTPGGPVSEPGASFTDTTAALTVAGAVAFRLPDVPQPGPGDAAGAWVRAWISGGDYGLPARVDAGQNPPALLPATLAPPVLRGLLATVDLAAAAQPPTAALGLDDFAVRDLAPALAAAQPAPLFVASADAAPTLYLGFDGSIGQVPCSMYIDTCPLDPQDAARPEPPDPARLAWEYRAAAGWRPLPVDDDTGGLTAPGLLRFTVPPDHARAREFDVDAHWIRARHVHGAFRGPPRAALIAPNTVWARHALAVDAEILGSGLGAAAQRFVAVHSPVLAGAVVDVRERGGLSLPEALEFAAPLGADAMLVDDGPFGHAVWVRWRAVDDLRGSGPDDRHYILDPAAGELRFGDGVRGRAVPQGRGNVRMSYETGGGAAGNLRAGALTVLKSSVAYLAAVTNLRPACGGADAESPAEFAARSPAALRHRGRAVAAADFEDLAREASPELARALAVAPRFDPVTAALDVTDLPEQPGPSSHVYRIADVPALTAAAAARAGRIRLLVVPRGQEARPAPSAGLLAHVGAYLRARAAAGVVIEVTGPNWVEVRVSARLVATSQARAIGLVEAARTALDRFLHPLQGGLDGAGWPFGRVPRRSDVNRILAGVPGVDHVRGLQVTCTPPPPPLDDALSDDELADLAGLMVFAGPHALELAGVAGEVTP